MASESKWMMLGKIVLANAVGFVASFGDIEHPGPAGAPTGVSAQATVTAAMLRFLGVPEHVAQFAEESL